MAWGIILAVLSLVVIAWFVVDGIRNLGPEDSASHGGASRRRESDSRASR